MRKALVLGALLLAVAVLARAAEDPDEDELLVQEANETEKTARKAQAEKQQQEQEPNKYTRAEKKKMARAAAAYSIEQGWGDPSTPGKKQRNARVAAVEAKMKEFAESGEEPPEPLQTLARRYKVHIEEKNRPKSDGERRRDKWDQKNPNPGWDTWYKGNCEKVLTCAERGDIQCLNKEAIPLCNLQHQQEGEKAGEKPYKKAMILAIENSHFVVVKYFLNHEMKWWKVDDHLNDKNMTGLHVAAAAGEHEIVQYFLEHEADSRKWTTFGDTAVELSKVSVAPEDTYAVLQNYAKKMTATLMFQLIHHPGTSTNQDRMWKFIKGGASLTALHPDTGLPLLAIAAKQGMFSQMQVMIHAGADLNWRDPKTGHAIVHMACDRGHFGATKMLIDYGVNVAATTTQFEMNCLHLAAWNGRNGIGGLLLQNTKIDVNAVNHEGDTALMLHMKQQFGAGNNSPLVGSLIEKGTNLELRDKDKQTVLFHAVSNNQASACKQLVLAGGDCKKVSFKRDIEKKQAVGVTCFELSLIAGSKDVAEWLMLHDVGRPEAEQHRSSFEFMTSGRGKSMTPLYAATQQGWDVVVIRMLTNGADPNMRNKNGEVALFAAAQLSATMVRDLLKFGAAVDTTNRHGESALFAAAFSGRRECVQALLAAGADVNHKDSQGTTALFRAARNGNSELAIVLLEAGADNRYNGFYKDRGAKDGKASMARAESAANCARRYGYEDTAKIIEDWTYDTDAPDRVPK